MAIWYLDYTNGNNANAGTSWGAARKNLTALTTANLAPGDTIKIAKSPDPVSTGVNGAWTNLGQYAQASTALNATVHDCQTNWTAGTNVTTSLITTASFQKCLTNTLSIVTNASVTGAQLLAYKAISSTDFSGYQQLNIWINISTTGITAGLLEIRLCSDTAGTTAVDTFAIPATNLANAWHPVVVNKGSGCGSAIQSVAIYSTGNFASKTLRVPYIFMSKAVGNDAITLDSLIGKGSGNDEQWFPVRFCDADKIYIDGYVQEASGLAYLQKGYYGTSETVTLYKREPELITNSYSNAYIFPYNVQHSLQDSGTAGNNISIQGGYNTSTDTVDGETWWSNRIAANNIYGIDLNSKQYISVSRVNITRANIGIFNASSNLTLSNTSSNGCLYGGRTTSSSILSYSFLNNNSVGLYASGSLSDVSISGNANNNSGSGLLPYGTGFNYSGTIRLNNCTTVNGQYVVHFGGGNVSNIYIEDLEIINSSGWGIYFSSTSYTNIRFGKLYIDTGYGGVYFNLCNNILIDELTVNNMSNSGVSGGNVGKDSVIIMSGSSSGNLVPFRFNGEGFSVTLNNFTVNEATVFSGWSGGNYPRGWVYSNRHNNTDDNHKIYTTAGNILSDNTTTYTGSGISWKISPSSITDVLQRCPLEFPVAEIYCEANVSRTITARMRRNNTGITGYLLCRRLQLSGINTDEISYTSGLADTWEDVTISFTPTVSGVVEITAGAYGGNTWSVWVDDIEVS